VEVLLAQSFVQMEGMARGLDVGGRSAFAEHLYDRVSGDEMDEKED
jgi:hypothetical protein